MNNQRKAKEKDRIANMSRDRIRMFLMMAWGKEGIPSTVRNKGLQWFDEIPEPALQVYRESIALIRKFHSNGWEAEAATGIYQATRMALVRQGLSVQLALMMSRALDQFRGDVAEEPEQISPVLEAIPGGSEAELHPLAS